MPRKCVYDADSFCYVCGDYTIKLNRKTITPSIKKAYELYSGCKIADQDKPWAPHIVCANCSVCLRGWLKSSRKSMPFAVPMVWREQKDHLTDRYFCLTKIPGISLKSKHRISIIAFRRRTSASQSRHVSSLPPEKWTI
jgi:hypothetical protein